jgi:DNA-binding NarL/FixJ family response regulator
MISVPEPTTVDAWLEWFATSKQTACRAYLCTQYHLDALDAEALMNTARLQVFLHWATIEKPLSYFWQTLKHAVAKQGRRRAYERRQLAAYAQQHWVHAHGAARTAEHVADVLERVSPRQCYLLEWFAEGYADSQVAAWLQTTPQAVRVARHNAYRALRVQRCLPESDSHHPSRHPRGE